MNPIRPAVSSDASRIAEIIVTNYRVNFYPFFHNDAYYFGELNVIDTAAEYAENSENLRNCYVYDDGVIKGMIRINGTEIEKLYVEPQFQSQGIGAALLEFAITQFHADHLWALEYNQRGIAFYRRHGFELTGERILEDEWVPLVKMTRPDANMQVTLHRIPQNAPEKHLLDRINEEAFPANERIALDDLYASGADGNFELICIDFAGQPAGFFAIRRFENLRYLAFFAIDRKMRKKGIGGAALRKLLHSESDCVFVTELEAPFADSKPDEIRNRRKRFYLRSGFYETGWFSYYCNTEFEIVCSSPEFDYLAFSRLFRYLQTIAPSFKPQLHPKSDRK